MYALLAINHYEEFCDPYNHYTDAVYFGTYDTIDNRAFNMALTSLDKDMDEDGYIRYCFRDHDPSRFAWKYENNGENLMATKKFDFENDVIYETRLYWKKLEINEFVTEKLLKN